jgi:hypothetical protein
MTVSGRISFFTSVIRNRLASSPGDGLVRALCKFRPQTAPLLDGSGIESVGETDEYAKSEFLGGGSRTLV